MQEDMDTDQRENDQEQEVPEAGPSGVLEKDIPEGSNFQDMTASSEGASAIDIDYLHDVQVTASVEIGRRRLLIDELLKLEPGAILDLEKELEEPLDLLVNGTLIARGEVVVQKNKFGIRLVDICSNEERKKRNSV